MKPLEDPTGFGAGQFRALTGLSEKALRLYAERKLLAPAWIDDDTGYRRYGAHQVRDGITMDVLRRAQVPLDEMAVLANEDGHFSLAEWRDRLALRRHTEDFYLQVAQQIVDRDTLSFQPLAVCASPAHWIAVRVPLAMPQDSDENAGYFTAMASQLPELDTMLLDELAENGVTTEDEAWTAVETTASGQWLLAAHRTTHVVEKNVTDHLSRGLDLPSSARKQIVSGTLPARQEITFECSDVATDSIGVTEVATDYLRLMAFADYADRHQLRPLSHVPRRRVLSSSVFHQDYDPHTVFDVTAAAY